MNRGLSWSGRERNCVYMNLAGDRFVDASFASGLDFADDIDAVSVSWPGGATQAVEGLAVDGRYEIRQGNATVRRVPRPAAPPAQDVQTGLDRPGPTRVLLRTPLPLPPSLSTLAGNVRAAGRATLINLWAQWCAPCIEELGAFADRHAEIRDAGLDVVAWSVDSVEDAPRGRLQMVYLGAVAPEQLLADAHRFALGSVRGAVRSIYPGRWYARVPRDLKALADELERRGRLDDAAFYRRTAQPVPKSEH